MCGILGLRATNGDGEAVALRMLATLAHRGPDGLSVRALDEGRWVLGHARLAIIDLSPAGAQPMCGETGADCWITYNGEIYNHRALRAELERAGHVFRSHSDTEVLLAAYREWGAGMLDRLDGIFAFALWDGPRRRLWLVRDPLGVKPLYYTRDPRRFAFASEPKALLAFLGAAPTPDRASLNDYLTFGYVPGERTAFAEIAKLRGGHMLWWEDERVRVERYWEAGAFAGDADDADGLVEHTRAQLDRACTDQLESDVPVGLLVSGGLDSSAVASAVARERPASTGFVIGFDAPAYDERRYAQVIASACGLRLEERVVGAEATPALLDRFDTAHDEPFADSSSLPCLSLFELVRGAAYKVVLGGDGGDELFSGYRRYDAFERHEGRSQAAWPMKVSGARGLAQAVRIALRPARYRRPAWRTYFDAIRQFTFEDQTALLQPDWRPRGEEDLAWPFATYWDRHLDGPKAAQLFDVRTYLQEDILTKVDRTAMHWGVEARVPLLARSMVEFALGVSTRVHRAGGARKQLLKRALDGRVPAELLSSRKKGFGLPLENTVGARLREWSRDAGSLAIVRDGVIAAGALQALHGDLDKMWSLYALDRWWRRWIRGTA